MDNTIKNDSVGQGPNESKTGAPDLDTVRKWAKRDLATSIAFLNAIHSDPDMLNAMVDFIWGRMKNQENADRNQTKMFQEQN